MLRKVGESAWPISEKDAVVSIKDASYPIPFPQGLEFNSPAHGCWNIVHTGMLIPEAHQIYVCADNCMRGVVLTAAEMCEEDRFSFVIVEEQNLLSGNLEDVTIEGTADILRKLKEREEKTGQKMPKAVLLFTVCLHHFLGCDLERIYRELEQRFPEIRFLRCYMDPIMQKHGPTPDQKLRKAMYEPLNPNRNKMDTKQISILGSDFALDLSCDLKELLAIAGYKVRELQDCSTWEEYEELGNAGTFLCCYPSGKYGRQLVWGDQADERLYTLCIFPRNCDICTAYKGCDRYHGCIHLVLDDIYAGTGICGGIEYAPDGKTVSYHPICQQCIFYLYAVRSQKEYMGNDQSI